MEETEAEYVVDELHVHIGDAVHNATCSWLSSWLGKITNLRSAQKDGERNKIWTLKEIWNLFKSSCSNLQ